MIDYHPTDELVELLSLVPAKSTQHMEHYERCRGIATMLSDLDALARKDGCIAAAWALEIIAAMAAEGGAK